MDKATFRMLYPFPQEVYSDELVQYWIDRAVVRLDPERWRDLLEEGIGNFVAHHLYLWKLDQDSAMGGMAAPGGVSGTLTNKTVDNVSMGYSMTDISNEGAGHWNLSTYGLRYWELMLMVGTGGIQL